MVGYAFAVHLFIHTFQPPSIPLFPSPPTSEYSRCYALIRRLFATRRNRLTLILPFLRGVHNAATTLPTSVHCVADAQGATEASINDPGSNQSDQRHTYTTHTVQQQETTVLVFCAR